MHDATRVIRAGMPIPAQGEPFLPGPTFAGTYHFSGEPETSLYTYGRYHNPTWTCFEQALSELEGGSALVFASGMAAVTAVFGVTLPTEHADGKGSVLVMPSDCYYTTRMLAEGYFASLGVEVRMAPTAGKAQNDHMPFATCRAQSLAQWRSGWPIARSPRWICAWSGNAGMHWRSLVCSPAVQKFNGYAIPACHTIPHMPSPPVR